MFYDSQVFPAALFLLFLQQPAFPGFVQCPPGQTCPQQPPPQSAPPQQAAPAFTATLADGTTVTLLIAGPGVVAPTPSVSTSLQPGQLILGDSPHLIQTVGVTLPNGQPGATNTFQMAQPFTQLACYYKGLRQTIGIDYTVDSSLHIVSSAWPTSDPTLRCDYLVGPPVN